MGYTGEQLDECTCDDYVEVSYGSYSEKFCGDTVPEVITSCGSSMVIKFHSDEFTTRPGFRAEWEEIPTSTPPCNADSCLTSHAGHPCINYPDNADEEWTLQSENGGNIQLTFVSF